MSDEFEIDLEEKEEISLPDGCLVIKGVLYEEEVYFLKGLCERSEEGYELYIDFDGGYHLVGTIELSLREFIDFTRFKSQYELLMYSDGEFKNLLEKENVKHVAYSVIKF